MTTKPPPPLKYGTAASMARADRPSPKREVTMPRDLWTEIDAAVAARGISRAAWLQEAAREKLEREHVSDEIGPLAATLLREGRTDDFSVFGAADRAGVSRYDLYAAVRALCASR